jgi:hypothetical protein
VLILVIVENLLATMASVHQVVNGTRVLNAELGRHPAPISQNGQSVSIVWTDPFLPSCDPLGCEPVNFWAALIPLKGYEKAEPDSAMQKRSLLVVAIAAVDLLILG